MRVFRFASDDLLLARVRAGSTPAFEALFERHHRPLLAFCRHMLGSAADAEDAVQHTFMAAYADLMRSDKPITLRPWLYAIARHRCLSVLRRRREHLIAELPEPEAGHLSADVDMREELRATLADIAHLPEDQRAALILAELRDASHAEIAQILGCRQDKVKALVFQARANLTIGRVARDTPCADIREQLTVGGVGMRRTSLRRHVRDCPGCREFGEQLRRQRPRVRMLLPIAPGLGFKRALLAMSLHGSGGAVAAGVPAVVGTLGATVAVATAIVSVAAARHAEPSTAVRAAVERPQPAVTASRVAGRGTRRAAPVARPHAAQPRTVTVKRDAAPIHAAPGEAAERAREPERTPSGGRELPSADPAPAAPAHESPPPPAAPSQPQDTEPPGDAQPAVPPQIQPRKPPAKPGPAPGPAGGGKPPGTAPASPAEPPEAANPGPPAAANPGPPAATNPGPPAGAPTGGQLHEPVSAKPAGPPPGQGGPLPGP